MDHFGRGKNRVERMIDILGITQALLRANDYRTRLLSFERMPLLSFEDDSVLGFCFEFDGPVTLLERWRAVETEILNRHGVRFRSAGEKSWNVYSLFLSGASADGEQTRQIRWIEENLERTRKIAACDIATRDKLQRVLLPLLRLQYQPVLESDAQNERLQRRIASIAPAAANVALKDDVPPIEVVRLLGGLQ